MSGKTVITVGAHEPVFDGRAVFLDGRSADARMVRLSFDDSLGTLNIHPPGDPVIAWPYEDLRAQRDQAGPDDGLVLSRADGHPARLVLDADDTRLILSRARRLWRRVHPVRRVRLAILSLVTLTAVAAVLFFGVPYLANTLARQLSPEGEAALGEMTAGQLRAALGEEDGPAPVCETEAGKAALDTILARLGPAGDGLPDVTVTVLDVGAANAVALPGGHVLVFSGLLQSAETADEVAAVLAHEIGHVAARDPTRTALRSAGSIGILGLVFGDFAGGALALALGERMLASGYSQEAEAAADAFAHARLIEAGISPGAIADYFERMRLEVGETAPLMQHLLAHPALGDRVAAAREAVPSDFEPRPLLDAAGWLALKAICDAPTPTPSGA